MSGVRSRKRGNSVASGFKKRGAAGRHLGFQRPRRGLQLCQSGGSVVRVEQVRQGGGSDFAKEEGGGDLGRRRFEMEGERGGEGEAGREESEHTVREKVWEERERPLNIEFKCVRKSFG